MVSSVISQFLSVVAADRISQRVVVLCGGLVTPETLLDLSPAELRSAGLSWSKIECVREIAEAVRSGRIAVRRHARLPDVEIRTELTQIKGVGPWTADMYLMWTLARPDVWPVGDYGVRAGWSVLHDLPETISASQLRAEGIPFDGFRSTVAWYCWQGLHLHRQKL
jgi:DNA-3-methyladenine glycosylase II